MASKTIPQLNAVSTINGNALIPVDSGTETFKITAANLAKSLADLAPSDSFIAKWISSRTYAANDMVYSNGEVYVSLVGSNTNQAPASSLSYWKKVKSPGFNPQASPELAVRALVFTPQTVAANLWTKMIWVEEHAAWYAVSKTGTDRAMQSEDGETWTPLAGIQDEAWEGICYSPELDRLVVVDTFGQTAYSDNKGVTWTASGSFPAGSHEFKGIKWAPELGIFLCVLFNTDDVNEVAYYSEDGIDWDFAAGPSIVVNDFIWIAKLKLWVAVGQVGANRVITSPNGTTWTARATPTGTWGCVAYSPELELIVSLSKNTGKCMHSRDGITWEEFAAPTDTFFALEWIAELGIFLAVANSGSANYMYRSFDGKTWTPVALTDSSYFVSLAWSPQLGIVAALADGGGESMVTSRYVKKFITA